MEDVLPYIAYVSIFLDTFGIISFLILSNMEEKYWMDHYFCVRKKLDLKKVVSDEENILTSFLLKGGLIYLKNGYIRVVFFMYSVLSLVVSMILGDGLLIIFLVVLSIIFIVAYFLVKHDMQKFDREN